MIKLASRNGTFQTSMLESCNSSLIKKLENNLRKSDNLKKYGWANYQ